MVSIQWYWPICDRMIQTSVDKVWISDQQSDILTSYPLQEWTYVDSDLGANSGYS